jgi:predicted anti-sigma-YlaC factor YlaD
MRVGQAWIRDRWEHHFAWPRLSGFLDGDLAGCELERVAHHVDHCAECQPALQELARLVEELAALRRDPPASVGIEIVRCLRAQSERDARRRARRGR